MIIPAVSADQSMIPPGYVLKNTVLHYSYFLSDCIGQGYSSKVYRGIDDHTGRELAIKVVDLSKINDQVLTKMLTQQILSLQELKQADNILQLECAVSTLYHTYIISELCPDGDLRDVIASGCLYEEEAATLMQQIIKGYLSIHRQKIIHRDLKPMNIFLKGRELKIADFGFATQEALVKEPCTYNVGSPLYMPPESLLHNYYTYKSDIWALGVIYYEMLFGKTPWNARTEKQLAKKIENESVLLLLPRKLTKTSIKFLTWTLNPRLEQRMSPEDLSRFSFDLDPLARYSRFKQRLDEDVEDFTKQLEGEKAAWRARQLTTFPKRQPQIPPCYIPMKASPIGSVVQDTLQKPYRFRKQSTSSNRSLSFKGPNMALPTAPSFREVESPSFEAATKVFTNELHFCRFLSRLLPLIEAPLQPQLHNLLFYRLKMLLSCQSLNPYRISQFEQYRSSATFKQLMSTARRYELKWLAKFGKANDGWTPNYPDLLDMIKLEIAKHRPAPYMPSREHPRVALLDSLVSCYQLIEMASRLTAEQLSRQVTVSNFTTMRAQGGELAYLEVEDKITRLGLLNSDPPHRSLRTD